MITLNKSTLYQLFLSLFCAVSSLTAARTSSPMKSAATTSYTMVGGSRGAGWAFAQHLQQQGDSTCKLFVRRPGDVAKKYKELSTAPQITKGEAAKSDDLQKLINATKGSKYLVIAQTFPFKIWEESLKAMVSNCIKACRQTGATLVYLGRHYKYGLLDQTEGTTDPIVITEQSMPQPNSIQGRVLKEVEDQIEAAATTGPEDQRIKARIITHSYPVGPNLGDGMLGDNFAGIAKNPTRGFFSSIRSFRWVGNSKKLPKMQITYTADLARFIPSYLNHSAIIGKSFDRVNFGGLSIMNINQLGIGYSKVARDQENYELDTYNKPGLKALGFLNKEAKRAADVFYAFTHEILLDNDVEHQAYFDGFKHSSLNQVIQGTYEYYAQNK